MKLVHMLAGVLKLLYGDKESDRIYSKSSVMSIHKSYMHNTAAVETGENISLIQNLVRSSRTYRVRLAE